MNLQNRQKRQPLFLKTLYLHNFRNYENGEFAFGPNINVIHGDNAQGKSNLLEAVSLISTGRSFRTQHLSELIQEKKPFFYLEAVVLSDQVEQRIKISFDGKEKKLALNGNEFQTFTPLLGAFPSIFSIPSDLDLITDSPVLRRRFLNLHLAQSDPMYVHYLARFWRACKQRNCLLKAKNFESLDCWEAEMVIAAQYLYHARKIFLETLKDPLQQQSLRLTSNEEIIKIAFEPTYSPLEYAAQLKKMRNREKELGVTLHGPHRDDFTILINGKSARIYASEGQKKTIVTALRLSQWQHLTQKTTAPPLFAIDDYETLLDRHRQFHLNTFLKSMGQVFLTTPNDPKNISFEESIMHYISKGLSKKFSLPTLNLNSN